MVNTLKTIIFIGLVSMTFAAVLMSIFVSEHLNNQEIEEDGTEFRCDLWNGTMSFVVYNITYDNSSIPIQDIEDEYSFNTELSRFEKLNLEQWISDRYFEDDIGETTNYNFTVYSDFYEYNNSFDFKITILYYESDLFYSFKKLKRQFESDECLEYIKIYKEIE